MTVSSDPRPRLGAAPAVKPARQATGEPAPAATKPENPGTTARGTTAGSAPGSTPGSPAATPGGTGAEDQDFDSAAERPDDTVHSGRKAAPAMRIPAVGNGGIAGAQAPGTTPPATAPAVVQRPPATGPAQPATVTQLRTVTREIPYGTRLVHDPSVPIGLRQTLAPGVTGQQTFRYVVTTLNGHEINRRLVGTSVIREPRNRVVSLGAQRDNDGTAGAHRTWIWRNDGDRCDVFCLFADGTDTDFDFFPDLWLTATRPDFDLNFPAFP